MIFVLYIYNNHNIIHADLLYCGLLLEGVDGAPFVQHAGFLGRWPGAPEPWMAVVNTLNLTDGC